MHRIRAVQDHALKLKAFESWMPTKHLYNHPLNLS